MENEHEFSIPDIDDRRDLVIGEVIQGQRSQATSVGDSWPGNCPENGTKVLFRRSGAVWSEIKYKKQDCFVIKCDNIVSILD